MFLKMKVFLCLFLAFSATSAQSNDYEQEYFTQDMEVDQCKFFSFH